MGKHLSIDQVWVENRFRQRKRMTGKKLYLDKDSGFMVSSTSNGFTAEKKISFLRRFNLCSNLLQIAKSLFIDIQTVYDHLAMDPKFREEFVKLDQMAGKETQLNDALIEVTKADKEAFIADLVSKAQKYG